MDIEKELAMRFERLAASAGEPHIEVGPVVRRVRRRRTVSAVSAVAAAAVVLTGGVAVAQNLVRPNRPNTMLGAGNATSSPNPLESPSPAPGQPSMSPDPSHAPPQRGPEPECGTDSSGHTLPGTDLNMNSVLRLESLSKGAGGVPTLTVVLTTTKPVILRNDLQPRFVVRRMDTSVTVAWDLPKSATMADGSALPKSGDTIAANKPYRMVLHGSPQTCAPETWQRIWARHGDYSLELSVPHESYFVPAAIP